MRESAYKMNGKRFLKILLPSEIVKKLPGLAPQFNKIIWMVQSEFIKMTFCKYNVYNYNTCFVFISIVHSKLQFKVFYG